MVAAAAVAVLFVAVTTTTWLAARADASRARCDALLRHIHRQLEVRPARSRSARPGAHR